jgi:uncharacterized protein (DUF1786 family)
LKEKSRSQKIGMCECVRAMVTFLVTSLTGGVAGGGSLKEALRKLVFFHWLVFSVEDVYVTLHKRLRRVANRTMPDLWCRTLSKLYKQMLGVHLNYISI